jgi:starch-binding outer membrane protein, SusD/RagB family
MTMKKIIYKIALIAIPFFMITSCIGDLDVVPIDDREITSATVFDNPEAYRQVLAKLYAGLAISGQEGPAGQPDISGIDEGFSQYLRQLWVHQVLTTDEAVVAWNDPSLPEMMFQQWSPSNEFVTAMYNRIFYQISLANEYLRQTTDARLNDRGVSADLRATIQIYRAEARFLRALSYWHALDLFGNVPFVTDEDPIGAFLPEQILRADLFAFIESELLDILNTLKAPRTNEYGRADQGAAWTLLAKLYLNAGVYTGTPRWADALNYSEQVIAAGYELEPEYKHLFNADNNPIENPGTREIIFAVRYNGEHTRTYGGTTFIISAAIGGDMNSLDYGTSGKWGGHRTTKNIVNLFNYDNEPIGNYDENDSRAAFYSTGHDVEINDRTEFTDGYAVVKFTNLTRAGNAGRNLEFADTDFPVFRLADVYLMYAEAHLNGGGGDLTTAVGYINQLRERALGNNSRNITSGDLTLDFILDERGRELYWESHRRTDLIRFGRFAGPTEYVWPFKGGVAAGIPTNARNNLFPLPFTDTSANPNLVQNDGY